MKRFYSFNNKKGVALLFAIMILLFLAMVSVAFTMLATTAFQSAARDASRQQSFYYARSVGLAISNQIVENYNMSDIVKYLDDNNEIKGSYFIEKIGMNNELVVNGTDNIRFYYPDPSNKNFIYVDVVATYNGATEVVTSVFTCVNEGDLTENMFNLFSVYNIYSTQPNNQKFAFASTTQMGYTAPSVYLYNGEGQPNATFLVENNISALFTSNGNVTVKSGAAGIYTINGQLTSYGDLTLERIIIKGDVIVNGDLNVKGNVSASVEGNLFVRGNITITGTGAAQQVCTGNINATGNVTITSARFVGNIVGGENSNITLSTATVTGSINTRGRLTGTSSTISGNVFTGQSFSLTSCTVSGRVEGRGTGDNLIRRTTIGSAASPQSVFTSGNLNLQSDASGKSTIYGNVIVEGTTINTTKAVVSEIFGNLTIKKTYGTMVGSTYVVLLIGVTVNGNVDIRESKAPMAFSTSSGTTTLYKYEDASSCKTKITGALFMDADFQLGTTDVPVLLNMNGAWLKDVQAGNVSVFTGSLNNIYVLGGRIDGKIIGNNIELVSVELHEDSSISGRKPSYVGAEGGNVTVSGRAASPVVLNGLIYATGNVTLGDYTTLPATAKATVRAEGDGLIKLCNVYGELIVNGNLSIAAAANLYGNTISKYIYVNGDLTVDRHLISAGSVRQGSSTVPLVTGNRIYVLGNTTLNGQVGDLYLMGTDSGDGNKLKINSVGTGYATPGVNGTKLLLTDMLIIDSNQGGTIMDNPNCIVYIKSNVVITGELRIAGTLIIPQSLNVELGDVYARKIITPSTPIAHADNADLVNKLKGQTESPVGVITAKINGNFQTNSTLATSLTFTNYVGGYVNADAVTGTVNINGATINGVLSAANTNVVINGGNVHSVKSKNVTLNTNSIIRRDVDATGTVTVNSGCITGNDSTEAQKYTLKAATVVSSGTIKSNIRSSGDVTINAGTVTYTVQAAKLTLVSGTINGDVNITSTQDSAISGTVQGNVQSNGHITISTGTVCSSGSKFLKALSLNMTGGTLGANTNIHLTATTTTPNNYIRATTLNNVRVEKGNLTTIDGATVNGYLYVGGSVTFVNAAPSAKTGLYIGNSSQSIGTGTFVTITGPVHMPSYTGSAVFTSVSGEFWAPNAASITISGTVGGNLRANNLTLHPISGSDVSYQNLDVGGVLSIHSFSSGIMRFNGVISTNSLVVNCDTTAYTTVGTSYAPVSLTGYLSSASTARNVVQFNANVRVKYLNSTHRGNAYIRGVLFNSGTLYVDGGIYARYSDFYSFGYSSIYDHATYGASNDGYFKTNYGSFYAGLDATYSQNIYLENCNVYSNIDVRKSSGTTLTNCEIGVNRNNGDWSGVSTANRKKFSKYYAFAGGLTLNGTRIYGVTDENSGEHQEPAKIVVHVTSGSLSLSNSSSIGWYNSGIGKQTTQPERGHKSSFDGIYVSSGNLTNNSGCLITVNVFVNGNLVNNGNINLKGNSGYHYCGGYVYWSGSKSGSGWINYDNSPEWWTLHTGGNHGRYGQNSTSSLYTPNGNWQLTTTLTASVLNTIVNVPGSVVNSYNTNYFVAPSYSVAAIANINLTVPVVDLSGGMLEFMKVADSGGVSPSLPWTATQITTAMGTVTRLSPAALHSLVRSTDDWNPLAIPVKWVEATATVDGTAVKLNNRTNNILNLKVVNIGLVGGSVSDKLGLTAVDASLGKFRASKINDIMSDKGGNDMILYTKNFQLLEGWPWQWQYTKRQVGAFFFDSGIIPTSVFDGTYRDDNDREDGRYLWGNPGLLGAGGDCVWTFFTCADPYNPYTSAAKDLHIVIPANTGMQWSKDKDNAVHIIGNGRVFLYLRSGVNIKVIGNEVGGIFGWTPDKDINNFGNVRYADPVTGVLNDNKFTGKLQPRLYMVGVGGNIKFVVQDFRTLAYVYMPRGYSYNGLSNVFGIECYNASSNGQWDIYGMYVVDTFAYANTAGAKVNYIKTVPDLSNTTINGKTYRLSEFWDYPEDLPRAGLTWKYKGIVTK